MPIPYHRYVRYTDDGCGIQECLQCKAQWEWRGGSGTVRFCMYCGVEFKGQHEGRDQETPRWQHDLRRRLGDEAYWQVERQWNERRWATARKRRYWVVEERCFWARNSDPEELLEDWHPKHVLTQVQSAHDAYSELVRVRREDAVRDTPDDPDYDPAVDWPLPRFCRYEYRLRRCDA